MPGTKAGARKRLARRLPKSKAFRKKFGFSRLPRGGFMIERKALTQRVTCSVSGSVQVKDPQSSTGTILNFGTPVLSFNGAMGGCYDIPFSMQFQLTDVNGYAELTAISERYKLQKVKIDVHGYNNNLINSNITYMPNAWIEYNIDYDDSTVPTISAFEERMGTKTKSFNTGGRLSFTVRPKTTMYTGGGYQSIPGRQQYIDTTEPQVPHYGIKGVFRNVNLADTKACGYQFQPTYTVQLRDLA